MHPRPLVALAILPLLLVLPSSTGEHASRTEAYVGYGTFYTSDYWLGCNDPLNAGGACFKLAPGATFDLAVQDDRGVAARVWAQYLDGRHARLGDHFLVCGSAQGLVAREGAASIEVRVLDPSLSADCGDVLPWRPHGPTGTITLTERHP